MNIGNRIKQRRKELDLSVDDIASKLGKNRATIYRYESNDIENLPITILEPLAIILETTPAHLLGLDDNTINTIKTDLSSEEDVIISKYRNLDDKGKHTVNTVLDMEYNRCKEDDSLPCAAHDREDINVSEQDKQHDIDIMKDDNEW
jgi:transcriptional regulator with XRE-family HTH domain